jgi:periplasmic divalent cation tolerance protein
VVVLAKTLEDKVEDLIKCIVDYHPYECPAILTWPIQGGPPAFLEWIAVEVGLK